MVNQSLTGQEQEAITTCMRICLKQTTNLQLVKAFYQQNDEGQKQVFRFVSKQTKLNIQSVQKWFFNSFSLCAYNRIDDHKIPLLKRIIDCVKLYAPGNQSLTTFVKQRLVEYQEQYNLHPGRVYDFIYQMCSKFSKAKYQLAMLELELQMMLKIDKQNQQLLEQRNQMSRALVMQKQINNTINRSAVETIKQVDDTGTARCSEISDNTNQNQFQNEDFDFDYYTVIDEYFNGCM